MFRRVTSFLLVAVAAWPLAAAADPGDIDRSFSRNGRVRTFVATKFESTLAVEQQSNGKTIAAGWGVFGAKRGSDFVLLRLTRQGKLDMTFGGGDGVARLHMGETQTEQWESLRVLPNDKILAVGQSGTYGDVDLILARYKPNGRLDRSFNEDGKARLSLTAQSHQFNDLVVFPNGDIGVVGMFHQPGLAWDLFAARFSSDGAPVSSFDGGDRVDDISGQDYFVAAAKQGGKLVGAGSSGGDFLIYRYLSDGTPDPAFGESGGYTVVDFGDTLIPHDLVRLPDGKFLLVGQAGDVNAPDVALARFNEDGTRDLTWDTDGKVVFDPGSRGLVARAIALQPQNRFAVMGYTFGGSYTENFAALRFDGEGVIDPSFGEGGKKVIDLGTGLDRPYDGLAQRDGRLVLAGMAGGASNYHHSAARLKSDVYTQLDPPMASTEKINAIGYQFPAFPGDRVTVSLLKKRDGKFEVVDRKRPQLGKRKDLNSDGFAESRFATSFPVRGPGDCRLKVTFERRGYGKSMASRVVACEGI